MTPASSHTLVLPPDVAAYLVRAAVEVAKAQSFVPKSEEDLREWHGANTQAIGQRAIELMDELRCKLLDKPRVMDEVCSALSLSVYNSIRQTPVVPTWNPRYVAYAQAHGLTPDQMIKKDGGRMTNFLCWKGN